MKLYHPDAITEDLLARLDPPVRDTPSLTADLELPVQIRGDVVAHGAEMSLTARITYQPTSAYSGGCEPVFQRVVSHCSRLD
jgi:hypothetical protein